MKKYCPLLAMLFAIVALFATVQAGHRSGKPGARRALREPGGDS